MKKIYAVTSWDFWIIVDDDGTWYKITGPQRSQLRRFDDQLRTVESRVELVDRSKQGAVEPDDREYDTVESVEFDPESGQYHGHTTGGRVIDMTPGELKALIQR